MDAPREVKIALLMSWCVLVIETVDRFRRISADRDVNYYSRLKFNFTAETVSATVIVAIFIVTASRRQNWGRIALLISTLGGWILWLLYALTIAQYALWQWLGYGTITALELAALLLLFRGKGARWYRRPLAQAGR